MTTSVRLYHKSDEYISFEVNGKGLMYVNEFENGIVTLEPAIGTDIDAFARLIEGCFSPRSNFKREILRAFNCGENTELIGIKCVFNDCHICTATKENFKSEWIVSSWRKHFFH